MENGVFTDLLLRFGNEMGIGQTMLAAVEYIQGAMLLLAVASCFFGLKLFRLWFSFVAFLAAALCVNALMRAVASRGTIVTTFCLLGLVAAFLGYVYYRIGAFAIVALVCFDVAKAFIPNLWIAAIASLIPAAITIPFLGYMTVGATALWGGFTAVRLGAELIAPGLAPAIRIAAALVLAVTGAFVQYKTNRYSELLPHKEKDAVRRAVNRR